MTTQNQEERRESSSFTRLVTAGIIGFMLGAGYAIATNHEGSSRMAIPDVAQAGQMADPSVYFPAQYENQGKVTEEHVQAF